MPFCPILGQPADSAQAITQLAAVLGCLGVAISIAAGSGVFHRGSIQGPPRLTEGERVSSIWIPLLVGFSVWLLTQQLYISSRIGGPQPPEAANTATKPTTAAAATQPSLSPWDSVIVSGLGEVALLVSLVGASAILRPGGLRRLGLGAAAFFRAVGPSVVSIAAVLPFMYVAMFGFQELWDQIGFKHPNAHPLLQFMREQHDVRLQMMVAISAILIAPPAEELLFRGHLQTALAYGIGSFANLGESGPPASARWAAIILSSVAFAIIHPGLWMMPPIFILSICLGYLYERTGNLWVPILVHAAFNSMNLLMSQLSMH